MLASLHGSPQQSQGWDAFHPGTINLSFPYGHIEPLKQWQAKGHSKRSEDVKPDKKKGASRMQVKREAQKAMLARCKSNNSAGQSFAMLQPPYAPLGFVSSSTRDGAQCDSLKRKYDQALPALDEQLSSKRSLVESAWPVELAGFAAGQSVWRLRGGGQATQDEASEDPPAEGGPQNQAEAEGSQQAGQRVDALISEVASMMESAQRGGQASECILRLNRLESIPSLPRFNSLELADEMFADILKWDLPKGEERTVEVKEGEVGRTRGGGVESDDAQVEEFLKSLDPALANREPVAIQDQLQKSAAEGKDGAGGKQHAGARPVSVRGGAKDLGDAGENKLKGTASEQASEDQAAAGEGLKHSGSVEETQPSKPQSAEAIPGKQSGRKPEAQPKQGPTISQKPMVRSPRAVEEKPRQLVRPSLDILAQASASFGPTSPVASKDSLESPESPILSSLGGGPRRPKLTPPQQEKLRAFAAKVHWNWGAAEGTGEARQLCAELGIDMRQMKRWVESHRPKDVAPPPPQAVPFMGWGVPPGVGMMNPAYMSYMAGSPMAFPGAWPGMPRPPLGDGSWGGGPPMGPMGQPFNPPMQAPFTQPLLGPSFPGPPFLPGGFAGAGFGGGAAGGPLSAPATTPLNVDENQELVASAEALGKLLGDRVNTIPPEKLKEILAAWMAHKRNKREQETVPAPLEAPVSAAGGTKRKEPEPLAHPPAEEPSEGSLLQFSIPSLERGLSNAPSISTLLAEELASAAAEDGGLGKDGEGAPGGAFKGQGTSRDPSLSVLLQEIGGAMEEVPKRTMGPLERQVFGVDEDNMQMGPAAESGDDESASSSDEPSERRPGLRPRSKRRRFAESSAEEEEEEPEEPQSEENEEPGVDEEVFPHDPAGRAEGGQWQLGSGLEDRRLPPPLGYQGHVGQTGIRAVLFEKALTASDTSHLGRWVLPKLAAERYMPYMEHRDGTFMLVEDSRGGRWCCKYRWWPNNKSKMYVLEQTGDIVKHFKLHPGDTIHFCQSVEGHLMIYEQKKNSKQKAPVACAASPAPLPKRYAKRVPIDPKPSPKGSRKQLKTPKAPRSPPPAKAAYKLPSPFARVSTRGRTIRPSSRLRRGGDGNPENGSPALVYNASAGQGLAGRLVPHEWRGSAMLPPGGSGNAASDTPEVGVDPWGADELLGRGEGTAQINELARHFLQQTNPGGAGRGGLSAGVPRPLARTGSADLANEILALTNSSREAGARELSPLGAPSRQGSLTPVLQRTKSSESLPFSVSNFPPIPTGLESLSRSSSLNRTASLARAGSLLSRLPSDLEALSKMDNFPSFDFAATPPLPVESAFQPYGGTPGRQANTAVATAGDAAQNRRRAG